MGTPSLRRVLIVMVCALPLLAADFWQAKKFTDWTPAEVSTMLSDSPWAAMLSTGGAGRGGGGGGGRGGGGGGGGRGGGGGGRGGGGEEQAAGAPAGGPPEANMGLSGPVFLVLRWVSALPVRQALAKRRFGSEAATAPEAAAMLSQTEPYYILTLQGLPTRGPGNEERAKALQAVTVLSRQGRPAIAPEKVSVEQDGPSLTAIFYFPRSDALTPNDKEVEFVTKLGATELRHKFKLKDMVLQGALAL